MVFCQCAPLTEDDLETHSRLCLPLSILNNGTSHAILYCALYLLSAQGHFNYEDCVLTRATARGRVGHLTIVGNRAAGFPQLPVLRLKRAREGLQAMPTKSIDMERVPVEIW